MSLWNLDKLLPCSTNASVTSSQALLLFYQRFMWLARREEDGEKPTERSRRREAGGEKPAERS